MEDKIEYLENQNKFLKTKLEQLNEKYKDILPKESEDNLDSEK